MYNKHVLIVITLIIAVSLFHLDFPR